MENYFDVKNIFIDTNIKNTPKLIFKIFSGILKAKLPPKIEPETPKIPTYAPFLIESLFFLIFVMAAVNAVGTVVINDIP